MCEFLSVCVLLSALPRALVSFSFARTHARKAGKRGLPPAPLANPNADLLTYLTATDLPTKLGTFLAYYSAFYKVAVSHTLPKNKDIRIAGTIAKIQGWPIRARQHGRDKANILDESPSEFFFFFGGLRNLAVFLELKKGIEFFMEKKGPKFATHVFSKKKKNPNLHILYNRFPICSQF